MPFHDLTEEHTHQWREIGVTPCKGGGGVYVVIYECTECNCWTERKLSAGGREKLHRGDFVEKGENQ